MNAKSHPSNGWLFARMEQLTLTAPEFFATRERSLAPRVFRYATQSGFRYARNHSGPRVFRYARKLSGKLSQSKMAFFSMYFVKVSFQALCMEETS